MRFAEHHASRWLLVILWMTAIFGFSSIPSLASPLADVWDIILRKFAHAFEYAVLAVLFVRAFGRRTARAYAAAVLCAAMYAVTDEWHQSFVGGREAAAHDVLVDAFGAVIGAGLSWRLHMARRQKS